MPVLNARLPKHSCHKATGQGYVTIDGKRHYTGRYDTPQAQAEYNRMLAEWSAAGRPKEFKPTGKSSNVDERLTIKELMLAYWRHAETFYRKGDHQTGEVGNIRAAFKHLKKIAGDTAVDDFGPVMLKAVRQSMIEAGNSRTYINRQISRISTMFSWGVENELVPVEVANALRHVKGLAKGKSQARERDRIQPVDDATIEATLTNLTKPSSPWFDFKGLRECDRAKGASFDRATSTAAAAMFGSTGRLRIRPSIMAWTALL